MSKSSLIKSVQENLSKVLDGKITQTLADDVLTLVVSAVRDELFEGGFVTLPEIGTLKIVTRAARAARKGRNPHTGEEIMIEAKPESKTVVLKASKDIKEALNS
jgi:DNA-binding protein HU-beta